MTIFPADLQIEPAAANESASDRSRDGPQQSSGSGDASCQLPATGKGLFPLESSISPRFFFPLCCYSLISARSFLTCTGDGCGLTCARSASLASATQIPRIGGLCRVHVRIRRKGLLCAKRMDLYPERRIRTDLICPLRP